MNGWTRTAGGSLTMLTSILTAIILTPIVLMMIWTIKTYM